MRCSFNSSFSELVLRVEIGPYKFLLFDLDAIFLSFSCSLYISFLRSVLSVSLAVYAVFWPYVNARNVFLLSQIYVLSCDFLKFNFFFS